MKSELAPLEDRGTVLINVNAPDGSTLGYTEKYMREIERIGTSHPEFDRVFVVAGNPTVSQGISFLRIIDWNERERSTLELAREVSIPVIASGGAGAREHFAHALSHGRADAVLAASLFHYNELRIGDLKKYLAEQGIPMRLEGWESLYAR